MNEANSNLLDRLESVLGRLQYWHTASPESMGNKPNANGSYTGNDVFRGNRQDRRVFDKLARLANKRKLLRIEVTGEGQLCRCADNAGGSYGK